MGTRIAQLSMGGVTLLIGLLIVGQLRSQARPTEISSLSAQDLSTLIETLSDRNRELRSGVSDVNEQVREYRLAQTQGQSVLEVSREDLRRIKNRRTRDLATKNVGDLLQRLGPAPTAHKRADLARVLNSASRRTQRWISPPPGDAHQRAEEAPLPIRDNGDSNGAVHGSKQLERTEERMSIPFRTRCRPRV